MTPKPAPKAAPKKQKASAPAPKAAAPTKPSKAEAKKAHDEALAAKAAEGAAADGVDPEEAEEQAEAAAARSSSAGGEQAALAAANTAGEMSASFKNFRHHPDMENFYRFIYENDLRHEAAQIIDVIMAEKRNRKQLKTAKAQPH